MLRSLALIAALLFAPLASADYWTTAAFYSAPTAVTVDVVDIATGATVGDDLPATQVQVDGADSVFWQFDLATVTGFPTGCGRASYLLTFIPDAENCAEGFNPSACAASFINIGGEECLGTPHSDSYVHTSSITSAQGIDNDVLKFYTKRGTLPLLWVEQRYSGTHDYASPDYREWSVYFYTSGAAAPRVRCTVLTSTNPQSSLPSAAHCP